jgi:hypothetical protein
VEITVSQLHAASLKLIAALLALLMDVLSWRDDLLKISYPALFEKRSGWGKLLNFGF